MKMSKASKNSSSIKYDNIVEHQQSFLQNSQTRSSSSGHLVLARSIVLHRYETHYNSTSHLLEIDKSKLKATFRQQWTNFRTLENSCVNLCSLHTEPRSKKTVQKFRRSKIRPRGCHANIALMVLVGHSVLKT